MKNADSLVGTAATSSNTYTIALGDSAQATTLGSIAL
jgi:hypothetical protein